MTKQLSSLASRQLPEMMNTMILFLFLSLVQNVSSSISFVSYPMGGECQNVPFGSDGQQQEVCIVRGAVVGPSLVYMDGENVYLGQSGESFVFVLGDGDGAASEPEQHVATVRLGYNFPNTTECFLTVNSTDCCSCTSCLDADGNLVGMKADCGNVPNGKKITECQDLKGFFPLDLSLNGESRICGANDIEIVEEDPISSITTNSITEDTDAILQDSAASSHLAFANVLFLLLVNTAAVGLVQFC